MQMLKELENYISRTLGIHAETERWEKSEALPFFLKDAYEFFLIHLEDREYVLMADTQEEESTPSIVRKHMEQVRKVCSREIIYVRNQMSAINRNRLLHHRIPFIVPGNQLYLPMLAIDLRERFIAERKSVKKLGPAAQCVVLQALYNHRRLFDERMTLTQWGEELGYTKMSMTRAFRDLRTVFEDEKLPLDLCGRSLWERLSCFMKSPVRTCHYYTTIEWEHHEVLAAGDSALAHYTMMAEPSRATVCMDSNDWKRFQETHGVVELQRAEPGTLEVQVWSYSPGLFAWDRMADPLSVWLSYGKNTDARVDEALDQLLEEFSW